MFSISFATAVAAPLTTLEYRVTGTALQVTPPMLAVPKGIPGSVLVSLVSGGLTNNPASTQLTSGAYTEAILRGPGFNEPRRLVGPPNAPLLLPVINLVGDYQLDGIRLVEAATGKTRLEGSPSSVPVRVFDEVLVSRVTSRPLTLEEIQEKGIFIDEENFRAVEFEVAFVLDGKTIPIAFPVVAPKFSDSTEIIPAAELEAKLKEAAVLNQQISSEVVQLPPEFETAQLNIQVQGINFQVVDEGEPEGLTIPPIPALMVIPGNIGYLNQFFSVQIFTENAAPSGSGLNVHNVKATLVLPPGPDRTVSTNYSQPGDDPLRFARIGPDKIIQPVQTILRPGPDGEIGTADDIGFLRPGESGEAEFLVEGLQEGLHVMDLDLEADLEGLPAGTVKVMGKAAGSVLVRNPRFSMAFSHPRTVRTGEPYEATVTLLNTGLTPANLLQVTLNRNSISGAVFESGQSETVELGTLLPGETATATFRMRAQRTGAVSFSNLTTSDDSVVGRFRLSMGVDERGVALSPDTLALPSFVNDLPPEVLAAANRMLGQALSIATAAQLPTGVVKVARSTITRRVLDLAEAGQRIRYGDPLRRVLPDLLRDWHGGRVESAGFDQILRATDAGEEWRVALFNAMEAADNLGGTARLVDRAADFAGLGQSFVVASTDLGELRAGFPVPPALFPTQGEATAERSTQPYAAVYGGSNGVWAVTKYESNAVFTWTFTNGPPAADVGVLLVGTNGQARQLRWTIANPPATAVYRFTLSDSAEQLLADLDGDGSADSTLQPFSASTIGELPPTLLAVEQDLTVVSGRPGNPCIGPSYGNYGQVIAAVFSKPVTQASAGAPEFYALDGDNGANSVQIQPSGRVALMNLRKGVSALRPRTLTISGVTDARGNALVGGAMAVRSVYPDIDIPFTGGVTVRGRVLRGDGTLATNVPVTLTMRDRAQYPQSCEPWVRRVSQVLTDNGGNFEFDFVMAGIPYSISATDISGLSEAELALILGGSAQGAVEREHLERLANSASTRDTLLGLFSAGSLPEAIAKAEGLDRAVVNDFVGVGSSREGQQVPMALRFRGRATVLGQVVAENGTPIAEAAVNLFPDPDSRELGRGIFSDQNGQFVFTGVPLGVFTIDVRTSDRRARTVAGLIDVPGQVTNIIIAVPSIPVAFATLRGRVFEADNLTPHGNGRVFIGQVNASQIKDIVRIIDADSEGFWEAGDIPVREYDLVAVTFDGKRKGARSNITPDVNGVVHANITLEAVTRLFGRVQFDDGRPATNALVAGGVALVRSDSLGNFELEGVPVGSRAISAGLERNAAAGIDFPRLGSAQVNVIAGQDNYVVVKLRPAGRIFGKVVNAQGQPMPGIRVAIPQQGGFYWTDADSQGNYVFENLGLGDYTLSAPANAVAPQLDERKLIEQIRTGDEEQILAAFEEAVRVFVGADDPLITGEHDRFRPSSWGFTTARLRFDGENVNANIRFLVQGSLSGRVVNHQGVPIGARVRLTGFGPSKTGEPKITIRGERDTDPATGEFIFPGQLLAGSWGVQAASPFYPSVITVGGFTTEIDPDVTGIELRFPPLREINGRIAGRVFLPDGSLVGVGARVKISLSADYEIQTDTNGVFDTQIAVPAGNYSVTVFDPVSGLRGRAGVGVTAGITNFVDVHLLTRNSAIEALVLRANGQPSSNALVEITHGTYPYEARFFAFADGSGRATFSGLWEGSYSVCAQFSEASTRVFARTGGAVGPNETRQFVLRLGATATIEGRFVKRDLTTPIEAAQVAIGSLGFSNTDSNGVFRFEGVPLGTHRIVSADPVTGAAASALVRVIATDSVVNVQLVEGLRGEVSGFVRDSYSTGFAPGASVQISFTDGLTPSRTVTTGPDGRYAFPGSPAGNFSVTARFNLISGRSVSGRATGTLSEANPNPIADIQLEPLAYLPVQVVRDDGITPALNTRVVLGRGSSAIERDTDANGRVLYGDLSLGTYSLLAASRNGSELRNGRSVSVSIPFAGTNSAVTVVLPGIGEVGGTVLASDGTTPVQNAEVELQMQGGPFAGTEETALTDSQGRFTFTDVAIGPYRVNAANQSLAASVNGAIVRARQTNEHTLRLGDSGRLSGRIVRADGTAPVGGVDVVIDYASQSANPGRAFFRTAGNGVFEFLNIPVGDIHVSSVAPEFSGIIDFNTRLNSNGEVLDLGDVPFDEDLPAVVQVTPFDTAVEVPITTTVELLFSEALATNSIRTNGIFIRSATGVVASVVSLWPDTNGVSRLVRITPNAPLLSEQTYEAIVLSGDLLGATGGVSGSGPRDLVGRATAAPFVSRFTTADNDPPILLSLFPSNNAAQIDPRAVPRLSFNETLRATGFVFTVSSPGGSLVGEPSVGVNGQVLSFLPTGELAPNTTYTMTVSNVFDLAGNRAAGEPFTTTFQTLDTLGPTIATLRIASNAPPLAGTTVHVEALFMAEEPDASVRFTRDFVPAGSATNSPYRFALTLPASGSTTIRAIAADVYGNDGPFAELVITVLSNLPPTVQFTRVTPTNGPVPSGTFLAVEVLASDDSSVAQLRAIVAGIGAGSIIETNGSQLRVQGLVPGNAGAGQRVQIFAEATDDTGQSSGEQVLSIPISDGTAPTLAVTSPAAQSIVEPGTTVPITVQLTDNFGVSTVDVTASGAFSTTVPSTVSPIQTNGAHVIHLAVPANAPTNGEPVQLALTARDLAGNVSAMVTRSLRMLDRMPPLLVAASPSNGAPRQSLWLNAAIFDFDEPLNPLTITNNVSVTNSAEVATPFSVSLATGNRRLQVALEHPLVPGVFYTNVLLPGLADVSSNAWRNTGGAAVSEAGAAFTFSTASILSVTPTNGARFLAGQSVPVNVIFESGLGAGFFRFQMNGNAPVQVSVSANATNVTAQVPMPTNGPDVLLSISASDTAAFSEPLVLAPMTLNLAPNNFDTDSDGMPDAWEITYELDPFVNDAGLDPDTDALVNSQEFLLGTSPRNPDTDGDGLPDGTDPAPLNPSLGLRPTVLTFDVAGIGDAQNANQNYGDRVTNKVMGIFTYGGTDPFTPNVTVSYGAGDPALWTTGYGSLTNVLFEDDDGNGVLTITLTADTGFDVNLHRFDLAAYTTVFDSDPVVSAVQVLDQDGLVVFFSTNQVVSRTTFTPLEFTSPLSDRVLTIRVDARNLGNLNDDIAVDNLRFSQGLSPNRPPVITAANVVEIVQGVAASFAVNASDPDGNLRRLLARESLADENTRLFDALQFTPSATNDIFSSVNVSNLTGTLTLLHSITNTVEFVLRAADSDGLAVTHVVSVVTLPDLDRDGIPDRDDPDIDGDGVANAQEITLGTDSHKPDTDGDGLADNEEITPGTDGILTDPLKSDTDNDGVSDGFELIVGLNATNGTDTAGTMIISNRTVTLTCGIHRLGTLIMTNGAVLTHSHAAAAPGLLGEPKLELVVSNLVVDATSRIDVSARGYLGGRSQPNGGDVGRTLDNETESGSAERNGGSYGGIGGIGSSGRLQVSQAYGSFRDPNELGSGGGSDNGAAGNGGGLVRITAQSVVLDGQILANGGDGVTWAGGGSGGGIKITTTTLSGAGQIRANGGRGGGSTGSGGGGGRISVSYLTASSSILDDLEAYGGNLGERPGTPGTIYLQPASQPDQLIVDGGRVETLLTATPMVSLAGSHSTTLHDHVLTDRRALFIPGSLIGLELQVGISSSARFRIVANDHVRIFTDPADGRLTDVAVTGGAYRAELAVGRMVIRDGATVEIVDAARDRADRRARLNAGDLELSGSAWLTHPLATIASQFGLELAITNTLTISANSRIDVSGRGYLGGRSGGNGNTGRTLGNTTEGGSGTRSGGSYGGLGSPGTESPFVNAVYGSFRDPNEVGSGGGSDNGAAGNGGGLVRISAPTVEVGGQILANGGDGSTWAGGGSGGGIKITTTTLKGAGQIQANGGRGAGTTGGGGGGGRIAVRYDSVEGFAFAAVQANGGIGAGQGASGTIHLQRSDEPVVLVVRGSGQETPLPQFQGDEHLVLDGALVSATNINVATLTLTNGAVLRHPGAGLTNEYRLEITADTLSISTNSRIDVSARGYLGDRSGANTDNGGRTLGNTTEGGSGNRSGGSYGGLGAPGESVHPVNSVYGSFRDPNELGSGGGSDNGAAGNGGGLVRISAQTVVVDGQILADGGDGVTWAGGGSGGGIKITTTTLKGAGQIHAHGGRGAGTTGSGGGGGRIAILYDFVEGFDFAEVQANGGGGAGQGASGTIFIARGDDIPLLVVRGNGRETPLPITLAGEHVLLDNTLVSVTNVSVTTLTLTNGAVLRHPGAGLTNEYRLEITADTLSISTNSRIDVSARGYLGDRSGANTDNGGRTLGNTTEGGSGNRSGGSYGGLGAPGESVHPVNSVYGSFRDPNELGSGGGSDNGAAGNGGGLVRISAQTVVVDGQILADGGDGVTWAGGGSGGGIKITTTTLKGAGQIHAHGGRGAGTTGSAGGGGRIAIQFVTAAGFELTNVAALGGLSGAVQGTPGTVYLQSAAAPLGELIVDAFGINAPVAFTPLYSLAGGSNTAVAANVLTDTNANFVPGSLIGLRLKPNTSQSVTFRIIANTATNITTDPLDGDLTTVAVTGSTYSAALSVGHLALRGGAKVDLLDADQARLDRRGRMQAITGEIIEGSVLSHPLSTINSQFGLELVVDELLVVDSESRIDASARGYLGARAGGNSGNSGRTFGNTTVGGSSSRNGGSYGGSGAFGSSGGNIINALYGNPENPNEPGSGGGSDNGAAGNGGGLVRLHVATLNLNGQILANGGTGVTWAGGGSGGGIKVVTRNLNGSGAIRAHGGMGAGTVGGGGGGGRIAIHFQEEFSFAFSNVVAHGGVGAGLGANGTVFLLQTNFTAEEPSDLRIAGIGLASGAEPNSLQPAADSGELTEIALDCFGPPGRRFVVEASGDLIEWAQIRASITEPAPGRFRARIAINLTGTERYFFRLREASKVVERR